ncbi:MAG: hypothetical protein ACPGO3_11230 [Magnetospiraceae bacterium]
MYADNTLTPKEATRLCALGTLAAGPMRYGALANAIRQFLGHISGPSLDLMGPSIELLKFEGLVTPLEGEGMEDDALLAVTEDGMDALRTLLKAPVRSSSTDLNMLIITLKFRFLHLLPPPDQRDQIHLLADASETEMERLIALRRQHAREPGYLTHWLDHDISELESRLTWLQEMERILESAPDPA